MKPVLPTNDEEASAAVDRLLAAGENRVFALTQLTRTDILSARHTGNYRMLYAYERLLSKDHMIWLIHDALMVMQHMNVEFPEAALTPEHLDIHRAIGDAVTEEFGNTPHTRDFALQAYVVAFADLTRARSIPNIIKERKVDRIELLHEILDSMDDVHPAFKDSVL
jgi:elongation factor P--beta-lysine ligase